VPLEGSDMNMAPIGVDPPIQKDYRRLIDRHFAPKTLAISVRNSWCWQSPTI
jgi:hypothetical protein